MLHRRMKIEKQMKIMKKFAKISLNLKSIVKEINVKLRWYIDQKIRTGKMKGSHLMRIKLNIERKNHSQNM